jgi:hypothetical protein
MQTWTHAGGAMSGCGIGRTGKRPNTHATAWNSASTSRALAELAAKERAMYELENSKDQVMACLKLALANLGMWVRAQYFPATYAHATWYRLAPFFRLPGCVTEGKQMVWVESRFMIVSSIEICRRYVNGSKRPHLTCLTGDASASLSQAGGARRIQRSPGQSGVNL